MTIGQRAQRHQRIQDMQAGATTRKQNLVAGLPQMQQQRQNLITRINKMGGKQSAPGLTNRLRNVSGNIREARNFQQQNPTTPTTQTPPAQETTQPTDTTARTQLSPEQVDQFRALFPGQRMFEPQNYQGSPLYQFQADQGQKRLDRLYASRGLTGSGAEIAGNKEFLNELGAREADRQQGVAQTEADRLYRFLEDNAMRGERNSDRSFDRAYRTTDLMLSQNPMNYAYDAAGDLAGLYGKQGDANASFAANNYSRVFGGANPGGSVSYPTFTPPFPSGPNMTGIDAVSTVGDLDSSIGWLEALKTLPNLINAYRGGS